MMNEYAALSLRQVSRELLSADSVLICIHRGPDGDCVGSGFGLRRMLERLGKRARVICGDPIPHRLAFLAADQEDCLYIPGMEEEYALLCSVDTASPSQLRELGGLTEKITLSIDHHGSNTPYCDSHTDPTAAAAGEILARLYLMWRADGIIPRDGEAVRRLYSAIVSDTGGFKTASTTRETLLCAAELMGELAAVQDGGDDAAMLCHRLFECRTMTELYAQRAGINALRLAHNGEIGVVVFTTEMLRQAGITYEDIGNIVALPRGVEGVKIALSVKQDEAEPTLWRVSSRASCDVDVAAVCASFGGGGHRRAAGCSITAPDAEAAFALVSEAFGAALEGQHE